MSDTKQTVTIEKVKYASFYKRSSITIYRSPSSGSRKLDGKEGGGKDKEQKSIALLAPYNPSHPTPHFGFCSIYFCVGDIPISECHCIGNCCLKGMISCSMCPWWIVVLAEYAILLKKKKHRVKTKGTGKTQEKYRVDKFIFIKVWQPFYSSVR